MLKLTNSFYRYLGFTCEKVNKTHVRRFSHLHCDRKTCSAGRADINLTAQFHSNLQLLQHGHGKKRLKIKIPPLGFNKCKKNKPMSDQFYPSLNHASYGGEFEVTPTANYNPWKPITSTAAFNGGKLSFTIPPNFRMWEPVAVARNYSKGPSIRFKVLSYNLLAQYLVECHPYLYTACWPYDIKWSTRATRLFNEIISLSPDILCLQEVQVTHLDTFFSRFEQMGYSKVFKQRTGHRLDGCAIYFKNSMFALVSHVAVEFHQPELTMLNRDNVGIMVKLMPYALPNSPLVVATTHLLFNPKRPEVKVAQMKVFLAELDRFAYCEQGNTARFLPLILTGDLNSTPGSPVTQLLELGHVDVGPRRDDSDWRRIGVTDTCQHLSVLVDRQQGRDTNFSRIKLYNSDNCPGGEAFGHSPTLVDQYSNLFNGNHVSQSFQLNSVYDSHHTATTFQNQWITVDYMYFSRLSPLTLLERLRLPTQAECHVLGCLPNHVYGSDHLALAATFEFCNFHPALHQTH